MTSAVSTTNSISTPSDPSSYTIRPIPLEKSGIPEYMHSIVQSVVGNGTLQSARNVLIADTNHDDVVQQENITLFVRGRVEGGNAVVREGIPIGKAVPARISYFDDIEDRDVRGITETGWDDEEFYHHCLDHVRLFDKLDAKFKELQACIEKLHPKDGASAPQGDERNALADRCKQLEIEMDELNDKVNKNEPFYNACCRLRDKMLEQTLKNCYDAGIKVIGVAGRSHISAELLKRIATRRVIVITLKGAEVADKGDAKGA